jgi:DNA-directed RNA polymerase sigma subunit (sigma70/sigma32)
MIVCCLDCCWYDACTHATLLSYLQEDRITPTEEKELGAKTQEAIRILNLKQQLEEKLLREPTDDEWCAEAGKINMEAIRQALDEGLEAKNRLVTANLRMVQGVVNIYIRNGLGGQYNAGDMMQEGIMVRRVERETLCGCC